MGVIRKLDVAATSVLVAGAAYVAISGLLDSDDDKPSIPQIPTPGYALFGVAALYGAARLLGPKTKRDQRLNQIGEWYDQADSYYRRAKVYRKAAEKIIQQLNKRRGAGK